MTAQVHENIILNGEKATMACSPPLPVDDPRIIKLKHDEIHGPKIIFSTACWREYIGTWEIKDGNFYLVKIEGCFRLRINEPIFADWVTCTLTIPRGKILHYEHMGFESIYEQEVLVDVEKGVVVKSSLINRGEECWFSWRRLLRMVRS